MLVVSHAGTEDGRTAAPAGARGRTHASRFGLLSLTAVTFSLAGHAQAADPDVTYLDDGSIAYKDLEHGSFELVTKEANPRHFLVEDPGQTIVLHPQGSSVSVTQTTNSAARMAELQAAQQDALSIYEKGLTSTGSSTPPPTERLPVEPINFIQTDDAAPGQELPTMPAMIFASGPEMIIGQIPPPPPTPPTLNAILGPTEIDTNIFDVFTATSGTFSASSPNGNATLTFGIAGGTPGNTVIDGTTFDVSEAGPFGTLYVDSATGDYTFVPDDGAINALTAPTTSAFTITVSDGTLSADEVFTIAIDGANDAAVVSGAVSGTASEAGAGGFAIAAFDTPSATGILSSADVDNTPDTFTEISTPTASQRGFGTFTMTAAGVWAYTIDEANSTVQALNVGGSLTDRFTVTTIDGTPQTITITINGANDAADISGATSGVVTEDSGSKHKHPTVTGLLTAADVDNTPNLFKAVDCPAASDGGYGTFTMTADGKWTYTLDDNNCAVQALDDGDTLTDTFTVTSIDGTEQVITITIAGADDADPHDFDHLAVGRKVISDPPFIHGTRGEDHIVASGHHGKIIYAGTGDDTIHGSGKGNLIFAGSGDDAVKGGHGDDRIYGGSGSDTIHGNDGCDTIIGGFGADWLTGDHGADHFVFLSATDSRAGRHDTLTDFSSCIDRIDVRAFGPLDFAAPASAGTDIQAHTIAWVHDGAANQTIVYVNGTDGMLGSGASGLLEIHLDGCINLRASDFIYEPASASAFLAEPIDTGPAETRAVPQGESFDFSGISDVQTQSAPAPAATGSPANALLAFSHTAEPMPDHFAPDGLCHHGSDHHDPARTWSHPHAAHDLVV